MRQFPDEGEIDNLLARIGVGRPADTADARLVVVPTSRSPYHAAPRLLGWRRPVFLDSSMVTEQTGRYSYLAADPFLVVRSWGDRVELGGPSGSVLTQADPFLLLAHLLERYSSAKSAGLPPFLGGAIGYFGYDLGRGLEQLPATAIDEGLADLDVGLYDWVLAADHLTGQNWLIATGFPTGEAAAAERRVAAIQAHLNVPSALPRDEVPFAPRMRSRVRKDAYFRAVRRVQEYLTAGDVYQVNLSQRIEGAWQGPTWPLYQRLRAASPVPYGAYLVLDGRTILSASPERFLRVDDRRVETRPIKGTRPRGATPSQDKALADELRVSEKDRAENLMIVDLMRNDLGKVCRIGSVRVPDLFAVEGYANVWQLVSTVVGELGPGCGAVDALRACFPGGSVTGCPKKRAMEIIEELEPVRRGVYCGAIGYLSFTGAMDTSIVIRTILVAGNRLHLQVGGAIVADSQPAAEYDETLTKGRAALRALGADLEEW